MEGKGATGLFETAAGGIAVVVAFDNCMSLASEWSEARFKPNRGCFQTLSKWKSLGCSVYIDGSTVLGDIGKVRAWCANCGLEPDGIVSAGRAVPEGSSWVFHIGPCELGVPMRQDRYGRYSEHVDWKKVDTCYTPVVKKITDTFKITENA